MSVLTPWDVAVAFHPVVVLGYMNSVTYPIEHRKRKKLSSWGWQVRSRNIYMYLLLQLHPAHEPLKERHPGQGGHRKWSLAMQLIRLKIVNKWNASNKWKRKRDEAIINRSGELEIRGWSSKTTTQ